MGLTHTMARDSIIVCLASCAKDRPDLDPSHNDNSICHPGSLPAAHSARQPYVPTLSALTQCTKRHGTLQPMVRCTSRWLIPLQRYNTTDFSKEDMPPVLNTTIRRVRMPGAYSFILNLCCAILNILLYIYLWLNKKKLNFLP